MHGVHTEESFSIIMDQNDIDILEVLVTDLLFYVAPMHSTNREYPVGGFTLMLEEEEFLVRLDKEIKKFYSDWDKGRIIRND